MFEITTGEAPEEWRELLQLAGAAEGEYYAKLQELVRLQDRHITAIAWDNSSNRLSIAMEQTPMRVWQILLKDWAQLLPPINQKSRLDQFLDIKSDEVVELSERQQVAAYDLADIVKDLSLIRAVADHADSERIFAGYVDREAARKVEQADSDTYRYGSCMGLHSYHRRRRTDWAVSHTVHASEIKSNRGRDAPSNRILASRSYVVADSFKR